jgi:glutamine amidotransferase-like uncharacterized protein
VGQFEFHNSWRKGPKVKLIHYLSFVSAAASVRICKWECYLKTVISCFRQPVFFGFFLLLMASTFSACRWNPASVKDAPILLFNGRGASPDDVNAVEVILDKESLSYATADSAQLNAMSAAQLQKFRLLIIPGGNFEVIGNHLSASAAANISDAVHSGTNYLGLCAGAFFAGNSPYNGLNLTSGVRFPFYSAENQGIRKTAVKITDASGAALDQYWEDGPQLTGWGSVVAKYPDGTPAVAQGTFGNGWVVLSGVHPEAPENWRHGITFSTSADADHAYAATLIHAALIRTPLPHF